jgi:adenylate kinase
MLGAPGAGKGTQAQRIAADYDVPHISTGDIFRRHLREETELGKQVQSYLNSGELVPDELTCSIVADRVAKDDCREGYVLDGFPRSTYQAEALTRMLRERDEQIDLAIEIEVPDEEIVERLSARRSCASCGAVYNVKFAPPQGDAEHCDKCSGELVQRDDDKPETIRQRLRVYHETTKPVRQYYEQLGVLRSVTGSQSTPDDVFERIKKVLEEEGVTASS